MSLLGIIRDTTKNPLGTVGGIIRTADSPISALGVSPNYGADGKGIGILLPPMNNEPVDPGKLGWPDISPPLPVIIFGKDEVCVGLSIGIGYEVKGMICHRDKPREEPPPPAVPPPFEPPPPPESPNIDPETIVFVVVGFTGFFSGQYPDGYVHQRQNNLRIESVKTGKYEGKNTAYQGVPYVLHTATYLFDVNQSSDPREEEGWRSRIRLSKGRFLHRLDNGGRFPSDIEEELKANYKHQKSHNPYRKNFISLEDTSSGFTGGGPSIAFGRWGDILARFNNFAPEGWSGEFSSSVVQPYPTVVQLNFDNGYYPLPTDFYPVEVCQDGEEEEMRCCGNNKDDSELLKLIARTLGCTNQGFFMEMPKSLLKTESNLFGKIDESQTIKLKSQAEFNAYFIEQFTNVIGIPEIVLEVPADTRKASKTEANRLAGKIVIPDLFSGIAMLLKLSLNVQDDESELRSFLTRILTETHLGRLAAYDAACRAQALQDWTGMQIEEVVEQMPVTFTPPAPNADMDKIDSNSEIKAFLQESKRPVKRVKFNGKFGFKNVAEQMLQGAAIIRSVFAVRIKPGPDAKKQIKDVLKGQHEIATGKIGDKSTPTTSGGDGDGLKDFIRQIESQFKGIKIDIDKGGK